MVASVPEESSFATKDQELLLLAALQRGADAVEAWKERIFFAG